LKITIVLVVEMRVGNILWKEVWRIEIVMKVVILVDIIAVVADIDINFIDVIIVHFMKI